jgi:hypothetical protein
VNGSASRLRRLTCRKLSFAGRLDLRHQISTATSLSTWIHEHQDVPRLVYRQIQLLNSPETVFRTPRTWFLTIRHLSSEVTFIQQNTASPLRFFGIPSTAADIAVNAVNNFVLGLLKGSSGQPPDFDRQRGLRLQNVTQGEK